MQHMLQADLDPASHILHGHICATFGPNEACLFWRRVIGVKTVHLRPAVNGNDERRIMLPNTHQSPAPRDAMLGVTGCWIVDFFPLFHRGPVVPQEPYLPSGTYDQIKTKYEGLRGPIWFVNKNGTVGIPMINALSGITDTLWGTENVVPNTKKSTHFTLKWRGYPEFPKQINMYDSRREQGAKYGQLARKVATFVKDFLDEAAALQPQDRLWAIQNTAQFRARILIIGLVQVTTGHYQPILQLCHCDSRLGQAA